MKEKPRQPLELDDDEIEKSLSASLASGLSSAPRSVTSPDLGRAPGPARPAIRKAPPAAGRPPDPPASAPSVAKAASSAKMAAAPSPAIPSVVVEGDEDRQESTKILMSPPVARAVGGAPPGMPPAIDDDDREDRTIAMVNAPGRVPAPSGHMHVPMTDSSTRLPAYPHLRQNMADSSTQMPAYPHLAPNYAQSSRHQPVAQPYTPMNAAPTYGSSANASTANDALSAELASLRIDGAARTAGGATTEKSGFFGFVKWAVVLGGLGALGYFYGYPAYKSRASKVEVDLSEIAMQSNAGGSPASDLSSTGYVVPQTVAKVGAKLTARVSRVRIKEGEKVKAGQILFELDPSDQRSAINSASAKAAASRARASAAYANVTEMQIQLDRQKKLAASGAVGQASVEDLEARVGALKEQARASTAEASAAQAEVANLQTNLGNLTIPSPMDGTAITKPVQVGDVVTPQSTLVELADFATLLVETDVPEARMHLVKKDGPCEVILDAFPDRRIRGAVQEVSPKLNRSKATGTVKVKFVDEPKGVLPEMSARVSFLVKAMEAEEQSGPPKKVVPASAVVDRGGSKAVFVVENGVARQVTVNLGPPAGGGFELVEGPAPGTKVVVSPGALVDGATVVPRGQ